MDDCRRYRWPGTADRKNKVASTGSTSTQTKTSSTRYPALDEAEPELEFHVRRVPFDRRAQELRCATSLRKIAAGVKLRCGLGDAFRLDMGGDQRGLCDGSLCRGMSHDLWPWLVEQAKRQIAERQHSFAAQVPANRRFLLNEYHAQNCPAARAQNGAAR